MKTTTVSRNGRRARVVLTALVAGLMATTELHASHVGESLSLDQQTVVATNQLLAAWAQARRTPGPLGAAAITQLADLARQRKELLVALLRQDPSVAAARLIPRVLRGRLPAQVAAYIEQEVRVDGTTFVHVTDDFAAGRSKAILKMQSRDATPEAALNVYAVADAGGERELHRLAGTRVTMNGVRIGDNLLLLDKRQLQAAGGATTSGSTLQAATSVVSGNQKTLSILLNFSDVALTCTAADLSNRLFGATGATVNADYQQSSQGLVGFSGAAVGPFTVNYSSSGSCDYSAWASAAEAAARAAGIDPSTYMRVNYVTPPNSSCGWTGLAYMPGRQSWVQACGATGVFAHELGHNLSLHHAATPTAEYGDGSDPMGGARLVGHNGANRVMAGWMPSGTVQDVAVGGSYPLATISSNAPATSPQVLRLPKADTAETYYVSLREPMNLDASLSSAYQNTLSVHRAAGSLPTRTYLLQSLAAGQTFSDATNGISITNQGVSNGVATVGVAFLGSTCTRGLPLVSVAPASQTGGPGATLAYTVNVTNQSSAACAPSSFAMSQALPSGFSGSFANPSFTLAPGASASSTWSVTSPTSAIDSTYTLTAGATDAASGNMASGHASDIVYTDPSTTCVRAAPELVVTPSAQSGSAGSALAHTLGVTNRNSAACGTSTIALSQTLPGGFSGSLGASSIALAPGASTNVAWSVASSASLPAGTYTLNATASDSVSGSAASASATDTLTGSTDTTPPSVTITSPASNTSIGSKVVGLAASASDASGIRSVEFYVDGKLIATDTAAPYAATWNPRKAAAGSHTVLVRAVDNAGNAATQSITVTK
jgi:hypothetical protein